MKAALIHAALLGLAGFVGTLLRYGLGGLVERQLAITNFPYGTLAVNLTGCLLIGIMAGLADSRQLFAPDIRVFIMIGLLGGFTTFSAFGLETLHLLRDSEYLAAVSNVGLNVILGLVLVWAGYGLTTSR